MRYFQRIAEGVDVLPLCHAAQRSVLWNAHPVRTSFPNTPHGEVDDILLRFNSLDQTAGSMVDDCACEPFPAWDALPQARSIVFDLMRRIEATRLGRAMITRLPPGGHVAAHADQGAPATYYERYHVAVQGLPGSLFRCGDETVTMLTGEVWWVRNEFEHEVMNNSADDRIHMIVDAGLA